VATVLMIFLKINCRNFSRLVWRRDTLPYRFRRHSLWYLFIRM